MTFWEDLGPTFSGQLVLQKPTAKGSPGADLQWHQVAIESATRATAAEVAGWIQPGELTFLGGDEARPAKTQVNSWIQEAHASFLLRYSGESLAFATLAPIPHNTESAELGRLLVAPSWRRRGFGTSLLHHVGLCAVRLATKQRALFPRLLARVSPANQSGRGVIAGLPFTYLPHPPIATANPYDWFEYRLRPRPHNLGAQLQELRDKIDLTQEQLAFRCGVQRVTITMIESGQRLPSLELLQRFIEVIRPSADEAADCLFASVAQQLPASLRSYPTLQQEPPAEQEDLWVITDALAEVLDQRYLTATIAAIRHAKTRWYFLPQERARDVGNDLLDRLRRAGLEEPILRDYLRVFSVPAALPPLRIAIHGPGLSTARTAVMAGEGGIRVPLSSDQTAALVQAFQAELSRLASPSPSTWLKPIYPEA